MMSAARIETNKLMIDYLDLWDEFIIKSNDDNKTKNYYHVISEMIDKQLKSTIDYLESKNAYEDFLEENLQTKEVFDAISDDWENILDKTYDSVDELINEIYNVGYYKGYSDIRERIRFTQAGKKALEFLKDYNFHLIRNLSNDLRKGIKNRIISGILQGSHPYELARDIVKMGLEPLPGSTLTPKQRATMIARTEVSRAQNTGILQAYVQEGCTQVEILTAENNDVCTLCLMNAYEFNEGDPVIYKNAGNEKIHTISKMNGKSYVPLHPNCRCTYLPVLDTIQEPFEDSSKTPVVNLIGNLDKRIDLTDEDISRRKETISRMVDYGEDVDSLYMLLSKFEKDHAFSSVEYLRMYNLKGKPVLKNRTDNERSSVSLPSQIINENKNGFLLSSHNHTSGIPIPSINDFKRSIENKIKYNQGIGANNGYFVIKCNYHGEYTDNLKEIFLRIENISNKKYGRYHDHIYECRKLRSRKKINKLEFEKRVAKKLGETIEKNNEDLIKYINKEFQKINIDIEVFYIN